MVNPASQDFDVIRVIRQLEKVEVCNSIKEKSEQLLDLKDNVFFYEVCKQLFNTFITYGVSVSMSKYPQVLLRDVKTPIPPMDGKYLLQAYLDLCHRLESRVLSGNEAKDAVKKFLDSLHPAVAHWFARWLNRKSVARGVGNALISQMHPEVVQDFYIQKCDVYMILNPDSRRDEVKLAVDFKNWDWILEPKFDGERGVFIWDPATKTFVPHTSGGNLHNNCQTIISELKALGLKDCVLDGELMAADWNNSSSILHTEEEHPDRDTLHFYVFDYIPLADWNAGKASIKQAEAKSILSRIKPFTTLKDGIRSNGGHVHYVEGVKVTSDDEARAKTREFFARGWEGGVLKRMESYHQRWTVNKNGARENNKSADWLKLKFWNTSDFRIVGVVWSTDPNKEYNIRYRTRTGEERLLLESILLDIDGSQVACGTMNDQDRLFYTDKVKDIVGQWCEVKFQRNAAQFKTDVLRFPSHVRYRPDK